MYFEIWNNTHTLMAYSFILFKAIFFGFLLVSVDFFDENVYFSFVCTNIEKNSQCKQFIVIEKYNKNLWISNVNT